jgi:hypothetical protein
VSDLKSTLPPPEEMKALQTMTVTTKKLADFTSKKVKVNFFTDGEPVTAALYEIDDPKIVGYMPSKMWWSNDGLYMLYYTCQGMPAAARPFGDKPVYCFCFLYENREVEYDANWRVFLDQINTPGGMLFVAMFGNDLYNEIVKEEV